MAAVAAAAAAEAAPSQPPRPPPPLSAPLARASGEQAQQQRKVRPARGKQTRAHVPVGGGRLRLAAAALAPLARPAPLQREADALFMYACAHTLGKKQARAVRLLARGFLAASCARVVLAALERAAPGLKLRPSRLGALESAAAGVREDEALRPAAPALRVSMCMRGNPATAFRFSRACVTPHL